MCRGQVEIEARSLAFDANHDADQTIQTLRDLFAGLRMIDAPKTLILISEGFVLSDDAMIIELGTLAAEARTSLYALKLDNQMFDIADARMPINPFADRQARSRGELLAGAARGSCSPHGTASRVRAMSRRSRLLPARRRIGARDRTPRRTRCGSTCPQGVDRAIAASRLNTRPNDGTGARSPRQAVAAALGSPLLASALPLRVASFALQGPERDRVQLLIHADIGTDYPSSKVISVGYFIIDRDGRMIDSKAADMRLLPIMPGVPSPLQYTAGASLPPGDYALKFASSRRSGRHRRARVQRAAAVGELTLSELRVEDARCRPAADADKWLPNQLRACTAISKPTVLRPTRDDRVPRRNDADARPAECRRAASPVSESRVISQSDATKARAGKTPARDPVGGRQGHQT